MLKVNKLNKYYRSFGHKPLHVINDTSLEIPEKGIIAVIGASGAGKTTLINTISGLDSFKNGTIEFDDTLMKHYHPRVADKLRMKNYGFIFQNYYLLEKQTVYENVKVSLDAFDITESEKKKRINYVLNQLGIAKYTNKVVSNLSGGEQQRVSIARALVKSPRVIFADEPTGSLDEITTFNVLNIFKQISRSCAVFIVTHERDLISYYADYIIELKDGIVVKEFTPVQEDEKTLSIDQNIYLNELEKIDTHENEDISLSIYSDHSKVNKGEIKIAIRNGKIYLESSKSIKVLDEKSENHLIESDRKKIKDYVNNDFKFDLSPLPFASNKIGINEVLRKGYSNFKTKRPIKRLLKIVCVALSILTVGLVEGFSTLENTDLSNKLSSSNGNISFALKENSLNMRTLDVEDAYEEVATKIVDSNIGTLFFDAADKLVYDYQGFTQIEANTFALPKHDFKDIATLDTRYLTYGRLPKNGYEVVLDEYVIARLLQDKVLKNIVTDYGFFIGKTFKSGIYNYSVTVSGICRTKNPTLFGYEGLNFARIASNYHVRVIDLDFAKTLYPQFEGVTLLPGHTLINEGTGRTPLSTFEVDGRFPSSIPYDHIINKSDFDVLRIQFARSRTGMYVQTDGSTSNINRLDKLLNDTVIDLETRNIFVKYSLQNTYLEQKNSAVAGLNNILSSATIVAFVAIGIALLLIILSTYLSMLNQISDIAVYRSLGYSRLFLGLTYLLELAMVAFLYCLIGGLLSYFALFILDVIPLIPFTISTSFVGILFIMLLLSTSITVVGIIPIALVFRLTPASIYSRYNRKINNE